MHDAHDHRPPRSTRPIWASSNFTACHGTTSSCVDANIPLMFSFDRRRHDRTWGRFFETFEQFLAFSWPVITVTDARTGRAHIVTRMSSIAAFVKMIKTQCAPFSHPSRNSSIHPHADSVRTFPKWTISSLSHLSRPPNDTFGTSTTGQPTRNSTRGSPPSPSRR